MVRWCLVVMVGTGCGRGPGTLQGPLGRQPFEVRQATLTIPRGPGRMLIEAQDQENTCGQRLKLGNLISLALAFPADQPVPQSGKYPLVAADAGVVPGVVVQQVATDRLCAVERTVPAEAAEIELVEVRRDVPGVVEADLRVSLTFAGEVLAGSLHATTTTCANAPFFCDAN